LAQAEAANNTELLARLQRVRSQFVLAFWNEVKGYRKPSHQNVLNVIAVSWPLASPILVDIGAHTQDSCLT